MENRILKLCLDILEKGNEFVDCGGIRCNCCPFDGENYCLARIEHRAEGRVIAETYINKHTPKERNSTEKTFREVIADIKEGEVWETPHIRIYHVESNDNIVIEDKEGDKRFRFTMVSKVKFKLQRKEYTFTEAFKALQEGKVIKSCINERTFEKEVNGTRVKCKDFKSSIDGILVTDGQVLFSVDELTGKFYIND